MDARDEEIAELARRRLEELQGIITVAYGRGSDNLKRLLKRLFMAGVLSEQDLITILENEVNRIEKKWNGKLLVIEIKGSEVWIRAPKELVF